MLMDLYSSSSHTRYAIISYTHQTSSEDVVPYTLEPVGCVPVTVTIYTGYNPVIVSTSAGRNALTGAIQL